MTLPSSAASACETVINDITLVGHDDPRNAPAAWVPPCRSHVPSGRASSARTTRSRGRVARLDAKGFAADLDVVDEPAGRVHVNVGDVTAMRVLELDHGVANLLLSSISVCMRDVVRRRGRLASQAEYWPRDLMCSGEARVDMAAS